MEKHSKLRAIELFKNKQKEILETWIENQLSEFSSHLDLISGEDLEEQSKKTLQLFIQAISSGNLEDIEAPEYKPLINILKELSKDFALRGFTPSETASHIFSLKYVLIDFLEQNFEAQPKIYIREIKKLSKLLCKIGMMTVDGYTHAREELIQKQTAMLTEMVTPIAQVWDEILLIPIIGTVDSNRTQTIMDKCLQKVLDTESKVTILDITGVPAVDTAVANHIIKISRATRLMGCTCIISGIVPAVAQSIVNLGIDIGDIVTKSTLKLALGYAFEILNVELTEKKREK